LLSPPAGAGRAATFTANHLTRLGSIKLLKDEYLPLGQIRDLLAGLALFYESNATLTNNVVGDNWADTAGSGLHINSSLPRLLHATLTRNTGGDGSGIFVSGGNGSSISNVALINTSLVSHTVGITVASGNTAVLEGTLWGSGAWANGTDWDGSVITGTINVRGNPAFVNPDAGDYHIAPDSAAIDAGVDAGVTTDIDGDPRLGLPDIGADEYIRRRVYLPIVLKDH
jgi:hypothetical protein